MRVQQAMLLPIKLGLPFGDQLSEDWRAAVTAAQEGERLHVGLSTHPHADDAIEQMRQGAARGGRIIKLHPTVQRFYPDEPALMDLYAEAQTWVWWSFSMAAGPELNPSHPTVTPSPGTTKQRWPNFQTCNLFSGMRVPVTARR